MEIRIQRNKEGGRVVEIPLRLFLLLVFAIVILILVLWSSKRRLASSPEIPDLAGLQESLPAIANLTQGALSEGNSVRVLQNGDDFFPALFKDFSEARETIHFETFYWGKGAISKDFAELVSRKAREGVEVRLLIDTVGGWGIEDRELELMKEAGCQVAWYHSLQLRYLGRLNNRDHRKIAVIDGRIGYVFGHGVDQKWVGDARNKEQWRDTGARISGPVVNHVQAVFSENWLETTSEVIAGSQYFPSLEKEGSVVAHVASSSAEGLISAVELLHLLAIAAAQREILIQNPYFLPDDNAIELLRKATARGVKIQIMVPAESDSLTVLHAGHYTYAAILRSGARLYEYQKTFNHQKIMVIDGLWSHLGSTNFDDRSFEINDEINLGMVDPETAVTLQNAFQDDLKHCREVDLETWEQRSIWHRMIDRVAALINEQL